MNLRCPYCGKAIDLKSAEVIDQLTDEQALYLAAMRGLIRPVGYIAGNMVFAPTDKMWSIEKAVSVN